MLLLFVAVVLLAMVQEHPAAQTKADPKKLVEEYVAEATNDSRRLDLLSQLEISGSAPLAAPLKKALGVETTRVRAIDLAMLMQVRGLFDAMKPAYEAGEIAKVVIYGMRLQEKGAADWLLDRWKAADMEGTEWRPLHEELLNVAIELGALKKWLDLAKNKDYDRRSFAAHIVSCQVGETITDADEVVTKWPEWEKLLKAEGTLQPSAGLNLQHRGPWESKSRKDWGFNSRIDEGGFIDCRGCAPPSSAVGSFVITMRVFIPADATVQVSLVSRVATAPAGVGNGHPLSFADKKWHLEAGENYSKDGSFSPGKWVSVGFEVVRPPKEPSKHGSDVTYIIEGKRVAEKYGSTGDFYKVELRVERGYAVLGSVEYVRK